MAVNPVDTLDILRYRDGEWVAQEDQIIREVPVTIYVNGQELVTMLATPRELDELALGYLYAEGFLAGTHQMERLVVDPEKNLVQVSLRTDIDRGLKLYGRRMLTSGCGRGSVFYQSLDALEVRAISSSFSVSPERVTGLVRQLQDSSLLFRQTGGVHGAALADKEEIILFREDIGRHNAVDKIAGRCLLDGLERGDKLLPHQWTGILRDSAEGGKAGGSSTGLAIGPNGAGSADGQTPAADLGGLCPGKKI